MAPINNWELTRLMEITICICLGIKIGRNLSGKFLLLLLITSNYSSLPPLITLNNKILRISTMTLFNKFWRSLNKYIFRKWRKQKSWSKRRSSKRLNNMSLSKDLIRKSGSTMDISVLNTWILISQQIGSKSKIIQASMFLPGCQNRKKIFWWQLVQRKKERGTSFFQMRSRTEFFENDL